MAGNQYTKMTPKQREDMKAATREKRNAKRRQDRADQRRAAEIAGGKVTKKKASKKVAKKTSTKKKSGTRKGKAGSALKDPFPIGVCKKLVRLVEEKHTKRSERSELKKQRKELRGQCRDDQAEIDKIVAEEKEAGRGVGTKPFSVGASKSIVSLGDDIARRQKKIGQLEDSISDLNDAIREAVSDMDTTIAGQDPTGTLFENAPNTSKD